MSSPFRIQTMFCKECDGELFYDDQTVEVGVTPQFLYGDRASLSPEMQQRMEAFLGSADYAIRPLHLSCAQKLVDRLNS